MRPSHLSFLVAAAVCLAGASVADAAPAAAWNLKDLDGNAVSSSQFKGKVVILDFWATWCPPCKAEIPGLEDLYKQYAAKGLVVIGASLDQDGPAKVKAFARNYGLTYPLVMADDAAVAAYGNFEAIPTTFVIDRSGNIVSTHTGFTDESDFEKEIKPLL